MNVINALWFAQSPSESRLPFPNSVCRLFNRWIWEAQTQRVYFRCWRLFNLVPLYCFTEAIHSGQDILSLRWYFILFPYPGLWTSFEVNILVKTWQWLHTPLFFSQPTTPSPRNWRVLHFSAQKQGNKTDGFHLTFRAMELPLHYNVSKC